MPVANDIIQVKLVTEYDGVQMGNILYWRVDDVGTDPFPSVGLQAIMDDYVTAVEAFLSEEWKLVCGIYENITNPEGQFVLFDTQPGLGVTEGHPQKQVLRLNRYALEPDFLTIHRGSFSQSGTLEAQSTRGRVDDISLYDTFRDFLTDTITVGGTLWGLEPRLRSNEGTPSVPVYRYDKIYHTQFSARFLTLSSRKTDLCATA